MRSLQSKNADDAGWTESDYEELSDDRVSFLTMIQIDVSTIFSKIPGVFDEHSRHLHFFFIPEAYGSESSRRHRVKWGNQDG